jgi:capsular polysaccharide biosynthesis protein
MWDDKSRKMRVAELRQAYTYKRKLPENYAVHNSSRFDPIKTCEVSAAYIEKVSQVKVCQYYLFSGINLMEDFCLPIQKRGKIKVWKQWLKLNLYPSLQIEEAFWVTDIWSKNYFHWILECLPRILALRNSGIDAPLLLPEHIYKSQYIQDSLKDLKIECVTFNFRQTVKVESIFLPSHDSPCAFDPDYLKALIRSYELIDKVDKSEPYRKIYISRANAGKRKVSNENELIPILLRHGFEIVKMEDLSFKEQRDLMYETAVLLSIHGAGLANMIFMPKGSKVIELHPDVERYNSCFYHLAAALAIPYYYSFEEADHSNPQDANINVKLENINRVLRSLESL